MNALVETLKRKPWRLLTGTGLKWLAVITMLVDHTAATLVYSRYLELRSFSATDLYNVYYLMREIGRIAFPLFCFVLVEGFTHTRSKPKYALRLLLFAIVSEIPYDFALHGGDISYLRQLNIMFSLLIAFCALWLADAVGSRLKLPAWGTSLLTVLTVVGAALLSASSTDASYLNTLTGLSCFKSGIFDVSYHAYGILLIGALYLARDHRALQFLLGCCLSYCYCMAYRSWLQMYAAVGLACIALYNGKRGRGMKYFFYLFYPVHLLILGLLNLWLF